MDIVLVLKASTSILGNVLVTYLPRYILSHRHGYSHQDRYLIYSNLISSSLFFSSIYLIIT